MFVIISYMHVLGVGENEKTTNVYLPAAWCKLHSPNAVLERHQQKLQECLRQRLLYTLTDCEIRAALANRETKRNVISGTFRLRIFHLCRYQIIFQFISKTAW